MGMVIMMNQCRHFDDKTSRKLWWTMRLTGHVRLGSISTLLPHFEDLRINLLVVEQRRRLSVFGDILP